MRARASSRVNPERPCPNTRSGGRALVFSNTNAHKRSETSHLIILLSLCLARRVECFVNAAACDVEFDVVRLFDARVKHTFYSK